MAWLPEGKIFLKICLFVLTQSMNMMDGQTHRHRVMAKAALDASIVSDLLIPKVDHFIPFLVDHLCQFAARSVHSFLKYRVHKI